MKKIIVLSGLAFFMLVSTSFREIKKTYYYGYAYSVKLKSLYVTDLSEVKEPSFMQKKDAVWVQWNSHFKAVIGKKHTDYIIEVASNRARAEGVKRRNDWISKFKMEDYSIVYEKSFIYVSDDE